MAAGAYPVNSILMNYAELAVVGFVVSDASSKLSAGALLIFWMNKADPGLCGR